MAETGTAAEATKPSETASAGKPETPKVPEKDLSSLPDAFLGREAYVTITPPNPDGSEGEPRKVLIRRWTYTKIRALLQCLVDVFKTIQDEEVETLFGGKNIGVVSVMLRVGGEEMLHVVKESARVTDRDYITGELDADDMLRLFAAVAGTNAKFFQDLKKNGPEMLRQFGLTFGATKSSTHSKPPQES